MSETAKPIRIFALHLDSGAADDRYALWAGRIRAAEDLGFRVVIREQRDGMDCVYGLQADVFTRGAA